MPIVHDPNQPLPAPAPSPVPGQGAWQRDAHGDWSWHWGATPDPTAVSQWGQQALTDVRRDPTGTANHGAWTPVHGGGWQWQWGATPDPTLASHYGSDVLTNPDRTPSGADTHSMNSPPPPDVKPPTLTDSWNGVAPNVTGTVTGAAQAPVSTPPPHPAYVVSPGGIRDVEGVILASIDTQIADYNALKGKVAEAQGQHIYTAAVREELVNQQDRTLLQIGDAVELAGQFTRMLNNAAQMYARADLNSYLPDS